MRSFYKIHTLNRTWEKAKERCEMEGASLFYPEDQYEVDAVVSYWNRTQRFPFVYIGISAFLAKEVFTTVDGTSINNLFNEWAPGEPNNFSGDEDCLVLTTDGLLKDYKCNETFPFICKKPLSSIKWNFLCNLPDLEYDYNDELGRCYKFYPIPLNWKEAVLTCDIEQSNLAVINSDREAKYLVQLTKKALKTNRTLSMCNSIALGFNNQQNKGWNTILGTSLNDSGYSKWAENQPDGGGVEQCGSMFYDGSLNDIPCDSKCYFICENENKLRAILDERYG